MQSVLNTFNKYLPYEAVVEYLHKLTSASTQVAKKGFILSIFTFPVKDLFNLVTPPLFSSFQTILGLLVNLKLPI